MMIIRTFFISVGPEGLKRGFILGDSNQKKRGLGCFLGEQGKNRKERGITIIELTISFETNIEAADNRKRQRYTQLKNDLEDRGFKCYLFPLEIGSRGHVTSKNKLTIANTLHINKFKGVYFSKIMKDCAKISLLCSYSIFHDYTQPTWTDPPFLEP